MKEEVIRENVIAHIMAGKEMLSREENIQRYIDIIQRKIFIKNPFDRAIAVIFELVIEREVDPREIDLISFSKLYLKKVKKEGIDLFIAGKIMLMAWKILRMQSEEIIRNMEMKEEEDNGYDYEIPDWYGDDDVFYYTQKVLSNEIPLERKVRRVPKRKVTLIELINAFEEAKESIQRREKRRRIRSKEWDNVKMTDTSHKEDIEKDMKVVMEKLSKLNGRAIPLRQLYGNKDEMLSIFLPLLFLAKEGRIFIWQEDFPYGEIYIKLNHGS
ncbi:MAG: segregation/condensation protein A [Thermoplasmata archaeon]|jgi:segregation and condensation protein A|nr:segregation/condensation protein A [Thermoplasmata archaeon]